MISNRKKFIAKFVKRYYQKSKIKRRNSKNQAYPIYWTINNVCKMFFDKKLTFSNDEIYFAFKKNGFTLMKSEKDEFTWERFHQNSILQLCDLFINIRTQCNSDLKMVRKSSYRENLKAETIERYEGLKKDLKIFWLDNADLLSN